MASQKDITLRPGDATPKDIVLYELPVAEVVQTTVYLVEVDATPSTVILRDPTVQPGGAVPVTITGTLAATDAGDTAAVAGQRGHTGALAATEAGDVAAFDGELGHVGGLAAVDSPDSAALAGALGHAGTVALTDGEDTATFVGKRGHVGVLAATEGSDTCIASGVVSVAAVDTLPIVGAGGYQVRVRRTPDKRKKLFDAGLEQVLREAYREILLTAEPPVKKQAAKVVRPFLERGVKPITIPPVDVVDWGALEQDAKRVLALLELWQSGQDAQESEEALLLLMAA